ncbi:MAG: hypothetical protein P8P33_05655 [Flavobacteriaceae bacterium]|nr:hypothetical protein [Flavobacteriaceae bacterium]
MKYLHKTLIEDLTDLCERLDDHQYCYNSKLLNGASIGQHLRILVVLIQRYSY